MDTAPPWQESPTTFQQPPTENGQVRGLEQREHPPDLIQGVARLRSPSRAWSSQVSRSGDPVVSGSIGTAASAVRPPASSASAALAARRVAHHEACRPACRADPRPRNAISAALRNLASLISASLSVVASHTRARPSSAARASAHPRSRKATPPRPGRAGTPPSEAGQDAGNQGHGTDRFGDLQCPLEREGLTPSLGGPQEDVGVVEPRLGVLG